MKDKLDKSDRQILRYLQEDGRISNADLARRVGLSPPSTLQRVRKLESSGFVDGYHARLSHNRLGYELLVVAMISLSSHQQKPIDEFIEQVGQVPEILECLHVSGDYDFLLKIIARDMRDYERVLREGLATLDGIGKIHSCFVLPATKDRSILPI